MMNTVGAWASIAGVVIAIIGFIITIWGVMRSKNAAQEAKAVADKVRADMLRANTVGEFASALSEMEEVKDLHRQNLWALLPQRYSALRKSLILIKGSNPDLSDEQKTVLQGAIQYLASIEKQVERSTASGGQPPNVPKLNAVVSRQIDNLHEVLVEIRNRIGR
jgi:hypothetical protein